MPATVPVFLPLVTDKQANKHTNTASSSPSSSFTNNTEDISSSFTQNVVKTSSFSASPPCADADAACTCITNDLNKIETTIRILDILESFGTHITKDPRLQGKWIGKPKFLHHVISRVRKDEPIQLTMPAFPCKSANRENKVLGHLPDLGEELGLSRLNDIAVAIGEVYEHGAIVNIASDGILFNDVIGVTDQDTWEYGQELRAIIAEKKLHHVVFVHPQTLLGMVPASEMTREKYMETADECRSMLEAQYGSTIKEIEALITADRDTNSTYCGMVKFLETEISAALVGKSYKERKRLQKDTAKKMMQRSEAFTMAIRSLRPMDVRLSMHPSSGAAKLSISLIPCPKGFFQRSPWHSCVAIDAQGGYHCVHSEDVKMTHDLVYKNGRPYFYMVKETAAEAAPAEGSFQAPLHVEVAKEASFMAPMSPKAIVK